MYTATLPPTAENLQHIVHPYLRILDQTLLAKYKYDNT